MENGCIKKEGGYNIISNYITFKSRVLAFSRFFPDFFLLPPDGIILEYFEAETPEMIGIIDAQIKNMYSDKKTV